MVDIVDDKMKADEKRIKKDINDKFKDIINDKSSDKKLETLTKHIKDLKTKNDKLEKKNYFSQAWS